MKKYELQVSIIIPVFNSYQTIRRCLNSVLNQTYKNIEAIVIDDGSTDRSRELIRQFANRDKRIKIIVQKNKGVSSARNTGILHAKGDYISFLDSDDYLDPHCVETMLCNIDNADLLICRYNFEGEQKEIFNKYKKTKYEGAIQLTKILTINQAITQYCIIQPWGKLFKSNIIKNRHIMFNEAISLGEDTLFVLDYIKNVQSIVTIGDQLYIYSIANKNSLSATGNKAQETLKARMMIIHKRIDLADYWGNYDSNKINNVTLSDISIILKELARDSNLSNRDIISKIRSIEEDPIIIESILKSNPSKFSHKFIATLLLKNNIIGLFFLVKMIKIKAIL